MTVVCRTLALALVPRFLTGNLGRGFALIVRSLLRPRLLPASVSPRCLRICANTRALALGGNAQDRTCLRGFDDFNAPFVAEFIGISFLIQCGLSHHFPHQLVREPALAVWAFCGVRRAEINSLGFDDMDLGRKELRVSAKVGRKGRGKVRYVPMPEQAGLAGGPPTKMSVRLALGAEEAKENDKIGAEESVKSSTTEQISIWANRPDTHADSRISPRQKTQLLAPIQAKVGGATDTFDESLLKRLLERTGFGWLPKGKDPSK